MILSIIKKFLPICTTTVGISLLLIILFLGSLWLTPISLKILTPLLSNILYSQTGLTFKANIFYVSFKNNSFLFTIQDFQLLCGSDNPLMSTKSITISLSPTPWIETSFIIDKPTIFLQRTPKDNLWFKSHTPKNIPSDTTCLRFLNNKRDPALEPSSLKQQHILETLFIQNTTTPWFTVSSVYVQDLFFHIDDQKFHTTTIVQASMQTSLINNSLDQLLLHIHTKNSQITTHIHKIPQTSLFSFTLKAQPLHADVLSFILPIDRPLERLTLEASIGAEISFLSSKPITIEKHHMILHLLESEPIYLSPYISSNPVVLKKTDIHISYNSQTTSFTIENFDLSLHYTLPLEIKTTGNLFLESPLTLLPFAFNLEAATWNLQVLYHKATNLIKGTVISAERKKLLMLSVENFTPELFSPAHPALSFLGNLSSSLEIDVVATLNLNYTPINTRITIKGKQGILSFPSYLKKNLTFKEFSLTVHLEDFKEQFIPSMITLSQFSLSFTPNRLNPSQISATMSLRCDQKMLFFQGAITGANLNIGQIPQLWPFRILPGGYQWVTTNVFEGKINHINLSFDGKVPLITNQEHTLFPQLYNEKLVINNAQLTFKAVNLTLNYIKGLPFANDVSVIGTGDSKFLTINVQKGVSAGIYNKGGVVVLGHKDAKGQPLLKGKFLIESTLLPMLEILKKLPQDVTRDLRKIMTFHQGHQRTELWIVSPLIPQPPEEDIKIHLKTFLQNLKITLRPKGPVLSNLSGTFQFSGDTFSGKMHGLVDHLWSNFLLKGYIKDGKATTTLFMTAVLTPKDVELFKLPFSELLSGTLKAKLTMHFSPQGLTTGRALVNATNVAFLLPVLNHAKPYGKPASLTIDFQIHKEKMFMKSVLLRAADIFLAGQGLFLLHQSRLEWFDVSSLYVGETILQGKVRHIHEGYYAQSYYSPRFDIQTILTTLLKSPQSHTSSPEHKSSPSVSPQTFSFSDTKLDDDILFTVEISELLLGPSKVVLKDVIIRLDHRDQQWYQLQITAKNHANTPLVELQFIPLTEGQHSITLEVKDLGYILTHFDITDSLIKGNTIFQGLLTKDDQTMQFRGKVSVDNYRVVNLPILVRLLNFLGPLGIIELLLSDGLLFETLSSKILWQGDCLVLRDALTKGTSVRLFVSEALVNLDKKTIRVSGQLGILEIINKIGRLVLWPFVGDEGLFAASFSIKGHYEEPTITINPLSVLTPGIFGQIFSQASDSLLNLSKEEDIACQDIF